MTIRQMAIAQRIQATATEKASTEKKYSTAKGEHPHPYGIEGLCVNCYGEHRNDDVKLSDSVIKQIKDAALASAKDGYGWNDTDYIHPIMKSYVVTIAPEKRLAANRAMREVWFSEGDRIGQYIHSKDPSWTVWGQKFDLSILESYKQSIDIRA